MLTVYARRLVHLKWPRIPSTQFTRVEATEGRNHTEPKPETLPRLSSQIRRPSPIPLEEEPLFVVQRTGTPLKRYTTPAVAKLLAGPPSPEIIQRIKCPTASQLDATCDGLETHLGEEYYSVRPESLGTGNETIVK